MKCPQCQAELPEDSIFCNKCGCHLNKKSDVTENISGMESERKHVTVLFSDFSGYTSMTETLDPEEVKEIMIGIFGEVAQIIAKI